MRKYKTLDELTDNDKKLLHQQNIKNNSKKLTISPFAGAVFSSKYSKRITEISRYNKKILNYIDLKSITIPKTELEKIYLQAQKNYEKINGKLPW